MERETVFAVQEGIARRTYSTNAPREVISQCFDNNISKVEFLNRIRDNGYEVERFEADLFYHFKK